MYYDFLITVFDEALQRNQTNGKRNIFNSC